MAQVPPFGFYNMDCVQGMKQFPDKYFQLAIVDPPYGNGGGEFKRTDKSRFGGWFDKYRKDWQQAAGDPQDKVITWDVAPGPEYWEQLFRVSQNQVVWGGNYFMLPPTRCFVIWRKTNISEKFSMAMCEYAWTSFNDNAKIYSSATGQPGRIHPTQKPVELYEWLLTNYAKPGDRILDTHVGSASSLIACTRLGFDFVGYEINGHYYKLAAQRYRRETEQVTLFNMDGGLT